MVMYALQTCPRIIWCLHCHWPSLWWDDHLLVKRLRSTIILLVWWVGYLFLAQANTLVEQKGRMIITSQLDGWNTYLKQNQVRVWIGHINFYKHDNHNSVVSVEGKWCSWLILKKFFQISQKIGSERVAGDYSIFRTASYFLSNRNRCCKNRLHVFAFLIVNDLIHISPFA